MRRSLRGRAYAAARRRVRRTRGIARPPYTWHCTRNAQQTRGVARATCNGCRCVRQAYVTPSAAAAGVAAAAAPDGQRRLRRRAAHSRARVPVQMWEGWAQSRCRCGRGGPSPGAHVGGVGPVPVQMWEGWAQSRCRCGRDGPSPGADVGGCAPSCRPEYSEYADSSNPPHPH